jgi:hypothetical protein
MVKLMSRLLSSTTGWLRRSLWTMVMIGFCYCSFVPAALAVTQIQLTNVSYKECPPEIAEGAVTSGGVTQAASCFLVIGTAKNPSSKDVFDADVYGRIYDADNNLVLQNRSRVGLIEKLPPGNSEFEMRISVPTNTSMPLLLKKFKAAGFTTKIRQ